MTTLNPQIADILDVEFTELYDSLKSKTITFDPSWKNGTGYFDHAMHADFGLRPGEMARSFCPSSQRRIVFVGTAVGNVVLFERYTANLKDNPQPFVIVFNEPHGLGMPIVERSNELYEMDKNNSSSWFRYHSVVGYDKMPNIGEAFVPSAELKAKILDRRVQA
jgi:hypothetical protein